jgi:hypothetical protein
MYEVIIYSNVVICWEIIQFKELFYFCLVSTFVIGSSWLACILCITDYIYTGTSYNQNSRMTYNNKYIKKYINDLYFKFFTDQLCWRAETIKKKENQCFISSQAYFFLHFNITACWGETHFKFDNYVSFW